MNTNVSYSRAKRLSILRGGVSMPHNSGVLLAVVLVMAVFTGINHMFLTGPNLLGLFRSMSSLAIMSLGEMLVIVSGEIDLSVGATYGFAAMTMGILWMHGVPVVLALWASLLLSIVLGLTTASFVNYVGIPSFVVTLGMFNLEQGLTLMISNSQSISPAYALSSTNSLGLKIFDGLAGAHLPFGIPAQVLWMFAIALIVSIAFGRSIFGFRLRAIGGNASAAKVLKLPIQKYKFVVFAVSAMLAGLAGILDFSFIGTTNPTSGSELTFPVFAAVIIGGASLAGGKGSTSGTIIGALLLSVLSNGLTLLDVGSYAQLVFIGVITIGAVSIDRIGNTGGLGLRAMISKRLQTLERAGPEGEGGGANE